MPHWFFRNIFQVECASCSHILVMMCGSNRACSGGVIYHEQPPGTRQFPYTSLLTVYFSQRISIYYIFTDPRILCHFQCDYHMNIPSFSCFLCSQYLYHIALHRADLRHCGCFKVCNLPTGPLPTGRVFWTSKMPACGSWWSTLVNTLIYIENIQTCGESGSCRWIGGEGVLMFLRCGQQTITMHDIVQFGVI